MQPPPTKQVNVTELRAQLPRYLARVRRGETIVVTARGKPVARLSPLTHLIGDARQRLSALREKARIGDVVSPVAAQWNATDDPA